MLQNRRKEIGYLSDVAINAISLNKINYIPAQLFRASMKVLHSICNIFAFQMKNKCLQMTEEIKRQLWEWAAAYHCAGFIQNDPVQFPHRYERRQDIEISGLLTAIMSFGNRKQILKKADELHRLMGVSPHQYVLSCQWKKDFPATDRSSFTECFLMLTFIPISGVCMLPILLLTVWRMPYVRMPVIRWKGYVRFWKSRQRVPKRN